MNDRRGSLLMAAAIVVIAGAGCVSDGPDPALPATNMETATDSPAGTPTPPATGATRHTTATDVEEPELDPGAWADAPPLELFAHQPRYLQGRPRLAIAVTNAGEAPVTVTHIALRAQHFDALEPEPKHTTIAPGVRVDLQLDVGEISPCDLSRPVAADVELGIAVDGTTRSHTLAIEPTLFDQLRDSECARRAVADAVEIVFGDQPIVSGHRVLTDIVVSRRSGSDPIRVESVRGSVVFVMLADGLPSDEAPRPLRDVGSDDGRDSPVTIPVEISVSRCDPHVIGQAQKPYDFRVWVTVASAETVLVELTPNADLLERLDQIVAACEPGRPN